jgi:FMN phosphatase YigB (HAD superfamily)
VVKEGPRSSPQGSHIERVLPLRGAGRLEAVTFDFWNTLIDAAPTPVRTAERMARLHAAIAGAGARCSAEQLLDAFERVTTHLDDRMRESFEELYPGPPGRWAALARELGIPEALIPYEVVEKAYEDITLNPPAALLPGADTAVRQLKEAGFRLGVICNTGMAGGRVLRRVLGYYSLLDCFDVTTFSNEFGMPKPHPSIFEHTLRELGGVAAEKALHVGDMEDLDVAGARVAGLHSALYAPAGDPPTRADFVVTDWREFPQQIAHFHAR